MIGPSKLAKRCSLDIITHGIPDVEDEPCGVAWMDGIEIFHGQRHACACDLGHRRPQVKYHPNMEFLCLSFCNTSSKCKAEC
ncbi:Os09g0428266 [Oryza sativa Japonica Group]|uniref:Os09g0428266 protein n=1 Tax=Oryza sativa subsp. japonica TaxID=39947 RepID=C7J6Q0_ORYSJ|nr:Os09g0428266 [Oryza sativa Japonica Group]|eukprot:NP_001175850.1 Os09g0428266 [Oryza sativa Japonica Group]